MADFVTDAQGNRVTDVQGNYVTENPATGVQTYHFTNPQAGQHTIFQDTYGVRKIQIKAWNPTGYLVDGLSGEIAPAQNMNSLYTNDIIIKNFYEQKSGPGSFPTSINDTNNISYNINQLEQKIQEKYRQEDTLSDSVVGTDYRITLNGIDKNIGDTLTVISGDQINVYSYDITRKGNIVNEQNVTTSVIQNEYEWGQIEEHGIITINSNYHTIKLEITVGGGTYPFIYLYLVGSNDLTPTQINEQTNGQTNIQSSAQSSVQTGNQIPTQTAGLN